MSCIHNDTLAIEKSKISIIIEITTMLQRVYINFLMLSSFQNGMNDCVNCANGQDIGTSYELHYISSSGASITTCDMNGTDCSDGVCQHELQDNITDSRCQPPVPQFNSENVTVTLTARNTVGRSNSSMSRSISEFSRELLTLGAHAQEGYSSQFVPVCLSVTTLPVASFISTLKLRYEQLYYGILLILTRGYS